MLAVSGTLVLEAGHADWGGAAFARRDASAHPDPQPCKRAYETPNNTPTVSTKPTIHCAPVP